MLKRWVVAHRRACLGGPTGFLDETLAVKAYFTQRGARKAIRAGAFRGEYLGRSLIRVNAGDQFIVRQRTLEDAKFLEIAAGANIRGAVYYYTIPSIEGNHFPVHPDAEDEYQAQVESAFRLARVSH